MEMRDTESRIEKVLEFLNANGIGYELHRHPPLPTIELALEYWKDIDSTHCKNLFFRNHKGNRHYLVVLECHKDLDIHSLEHKLKQGKLSFASSERMQRCLGLMPGSVSPLGLINDMIDSDFSIASVSDDGNAMQNPASVWKELQESCSVTGTVPGADPKELFPNGHRVKLFLDSDLQKAERLSFHPCDNTASVVISNEGFMRFLRIWGGEYEWIEI